MHIYGGILSHRGYEYFYIIGYEKVPRGEGMEVRRTFPIILYAFLCNLCVIKALIAKKKIFFFFRRMCFYIKFNERSEKKDEANAFPIPLYYFGLTFQERSTLISQFRFPTDLHPPRNDNLTEGKSVAWRVTTRPQRNGSRSHICG